MSASSPVTSSKPLLSDRNYAILKYAATTILPAIGTLYFALGQVWHLPNPGEVVGSITALNTFFGVVLGFATKSYNNSDAKYVGAIEVSDDGNTKLYSLNLNSDPEALETMTEATFKVNDTGSNPIVKP